MECSCIVSLAVGVPVGAVAVIVVQLCEFGPVEVHSSSLWQGLVWPHTSRSVED